MNNRYCAQWILLLVLIFSSGVNSSAQEELSKAIQLQYNQPDSAIALAERIQADLANDSIALSNSFEVMGIAQWVKGRYKEAIDAHNRALQLRKQIGYRQGIAHSYNNIGLVYWKMNNHPQALENYHAGLDHLETSADTLLRARILGNIGILYQEQDDWQNALEFHQRSLEMIRATGEQRALANTFNNVALIQRQTGDWRKASENWLAAIQLYGKLNDEKGVALSLNNLGLLYSDRGELETADSLFEDAQTIYQHKNDTSGLAMVLGNLGTNAKSRGDLEKAIGWCAESYNLAKSRQEINYVMSACQCLADAYALSDNHERANEFLWEYIQLSDSVSEAESGQQVALMQLRYEHQKEQMRAAIERERERALAEAEIKRQRLLRNASVLVGVLILVLLVLLYVGFRRKQRANKLLKARNATIVEQREVIEKRSKEITESINYARRLQEARLPDQQLFENTFQKWHVLFKPRDIVSGDFYWLEKVDGLIYLAVADCTGHGVPGAMVSMIGIQGLNAALFEKGMRSPADILNFLDKHVKAAFTKTENTVTDGMDISLVCIDSINNNLIFSGAYNPLWIISQRKTIRECELREEELDWRLHEVKATRYSIGELPEKEQYINHILTYRPEESLVLFSDGMADQFGGPKRKKYGIRKMRKTVFDTATSGHFSLIDKTFVNWKADENQLDDVSVVCVSLSDIKV